MPDCPECRDKTHRISELKACIKRLTNRVSMHGDVVKRSVYELAVWSDDARTVLKERKADHDG